VPAPLKEMLIDCYPGKNQPAQTKLSFLDLFCKSGTYVPGFNSWLLPCTCWRHARFNPTILSNCSALPVGRAEYTVFSEHPEDWLVLSCFHQVTKYNVKWENGEC